MDYDRHTKTSEIGSTSIPLKEIKNLQATDEKITLTHLLAQKKQEFGEISFSLNFMPTAKRLSFHVTKATNLKYDEVVKDIDSFSN